MEDLGEVGVLGCTAQEVEPKSRAAQEVAALYHWIMEET